jgi:putative tricarboxylic transport membrane protein
VAPPISSAALYFGPIEFALIMILFLIAAAVFASGALLRSIGLIIIGLLLGAVGTDIETGTPRMTFGLPQLDDGLDLVALAIGLLVVADMIAALAESRELKVSGADAAKQVPGFLGAVTLGLLSGWLAGNSAGLTTAPGDAGETPLPDRLDPAGHETMEQASSAAAAGAARLGASLLPALALGIPTNAVAAILLGALTSQGVVPGPMLASQHPDIFWGLLDAAFVVPFALVAIVITSAGVLLPLGRIDYRVLAPIVLVYCCLAVYSVNNAVSGIFVMLGSGAFGYLLTRWQCDRWLVLFAFVISPLLEENVRRAVLITRGDLDVVFARPLVGPMLAVAAIVLIGGSLWRRRSAQAS